MAFVLAGAETHRLCFKPGEWSLGSRRVLVGVNSAMPTVRATRPWSPPAKEGAFSATLAAVLKSKSKSKLGLLLSKSIVGGFRRRGLAGSVGKVELMSWVLCELRKLSMVAEAGSSSGIGARRLVHREVSWRAAMAMLVNGLSVGFCGWAGPCSLHAVAGVSSIGVAAS